MSKTTVIIVTILFAVSIVFYVTPSYAYDKGFIALSVIIDKPQDFDPLSAWLTNLNYNKFTFVVDNLSSSYILGNVTRVNILKEYGDIIPRLDYAQQLSPTDRINWVKSVMANYSRVLGSTPKGVMDFCPDTAVANYLYSQGVLYYQGYCFDQYALDYITEMGGFQMPYFASSSHVLCPAQDNKGLIVLPHSSWDWVASFTATHNLQEHVDNLMKIFNNNATAAKAYFLGMITNTFAGSSPFGFITFQFEWSWTLNQSNTAVAADWIKALQTSYSIDLISFAEFATSFRSYSTTPTYRNTYTSPYDGESIEWLYNTHMMVARVNDSVVFYLDYDTQAPDKYLTRAQPINWNGNSMDRQNGIDDSLAFKVYGLGGGAMRCPNLDPDIPYNGDLANFPSYYSSYLSRAAQTALAISSVGITLVALMAMEVILVMNLRTKGRPK